MTREEMYYQGIYSLITPDGKIMYHQCYKIEDMNTCTPQFDKPEKVIAWCKKNNIKPIQPKKIRNSRKKYIPPKDLVEYIEKLERAKNKI